jgi:hypothetical protein
MSIPPPLFTSGPRLSAPDGDPSRQAIASLRGYVYQIYASAIAWLELKDSEELFLEVAEDYAVAAQQALLAVQVKDTADSGSITIRSEAVRSVLDAYVDLVARNPGREITVRLLSTSPIGKERELQDRIEGDAALHYWRKAAAGANVRPLRQVLKRCQISERVRNYINDLSDEQFRNQFVRHIHWECGQPRLDSLSIQLDASLVRYGAKRLNLPAIEGRRLSAHVITALLERVTTVGCRQLTHVDLFEILSDASRVSISRVEFDALLRSASMVSQQSDQINSVPHRRQLELEIELPMPHLLARRRDLISTVIEMLCHYGAAGITGGTGMGKTLLARMCARTDGQSWFVLDLRNASAAETIERLRLALGEISVLRPAGVILDDINEIEEVSVQKAVAHFLVALKRSDALCIFTLYRAISARTCAVIGIEVNAQTGVPELTKAEVGELVVAAGGDSTRWSSVVFTLGSYGHPQLILATIVGLRARSWPLEELDRVRNLDFSTAEIEVERRAARGRLVAAIPDATRSLLYRLSLVLGRFDRKIALAISEVAPAVQFAGEQIDQLIGPWIDQSSSSELRISPLISNAGNEMLSAAERTAVHQAIAETIMGEKFVDIHRADGAFLHGLLGGAEGPLTMIASSVITASPEMRSTLADWLTGLRFHSTDLPIFPANATISRLLRLAQFLIRAETRDASTIQECWNALCAETQAEQDIELREKFEVAMLGKVLVGQAAAGMLENWVQLMLRFDALLAKSEVKVVCVNKFNHADEGATTPTPLSVIFVNQALAVQGVSHLARLFNELDGMTHIARVRLLSDMESMPNSASMIVNQAWLADHKRGSIDWIEAAASYATMAKQALSWGYRILSIHSHIARAVMLDEYAADPTSALNALSEAESLLGPDQLISRARAKIFFRRKDHAAALLLLREIGDEVSFGGSVEQAYMLREAGICAAELDEWAEAAQWFRSAHSAASRLKSPAMHPMAIGLRADMAVAAYSCGDPAVAIRELSTSLDELDSLDPESSTQSAYCHRVVRHTGLWLFGKITGRDVEVEGRPASMVPGACSNPDPQESIKTLPLGPLSMVRYLLADAELAADVNAGILATFASKLPQGLIPSMEIGLCHSKMEAAIRVSDVSAFSHALGPWVNAQLYLEKHSATLRSQSAIRPSYGIIPAATKDQLQGPRAKFVATDSILAFGIYATCSERWTVVSALPSQIENIYSEDYPGFNIALVYAGGEVNDTANELRLAQYIHLLDQQRILTPHQVFFIGLRFIEYASHSDFKGVLAGVISNWLRITWTKIVELQRSQLKNPMLTVGVIQRAMQIGQGLGTGAAILLAAEGAVDCSIGEEFRKFLRSLI